MQDRRALLKTAIEAILSGGEAVLEVYRNRDTEVEEKADQSPLTEADKAAQRAIFDVLARAGSEVPLVSEEADMPPYEERSEWTRMWLIDPLDGTKEFIKRNGEFTVNVALVEDGVPVLGAVYAPDLGTLYFGTADEGAFRAQAVEGSGAEAAIKQAQRIAVHGLDRPGDTVRVVASRSHMNEETERYIAELEEQHATVETLNAGSSLKLCRVAEGAADLYPRFAPTMEWDTAAGQALVEAAGGEVVDATVGEPLRYNKEDLHNPWFVARGWRERVGVE